MKWDRGDTVILIGFCILVGSIYWIYPIAAFCLVGITLMGMGYLWSRV